MVRHHDQAFFEVGEGALDRVDRDPLKVFECPAESLVALGELAFKGHFVHEAVVGF